MRLSPILLVLTAGLVSLGVSQTLTPTAHAQAVPDQTAPAQAVLVQAAPNAPALRVSIQSLHLKQTLGGLEVTGWITNTGRQTLTYPAVVCVFTDAVGAEVGRAAGYLTAGPVRPGQSVNFRASAPKMPAAAAALRLREAGQTVTVQPPAQTVQSLAQSASRRTTVR